MLKKKTIQSHGITSTISNVIVTEIYLRSLYFLNVPMSGRHARQVNDVGIIYLHMSGNFTVRNL